MKPHFLLNTLLLICLTACTTTQRKAILDKIADEWDPQPAVEQPSNPQPSNPQPSNPQPSNPQPSNPQPSEPEYSRKIPMHGGGFLWKPRSESDSRLVVLTPTNTKGEFVHTEVRQVLGDVVLDAGRFVGDTHNGNRPHFRFPKTGAAYGNNLVFRAHRADGSFRDWAIPEGAARVE